MGTKWVEDGVQKREDQVSLWRSPDGRTWEQVSVISDEHSATETAFDFLSDERIVAFVRHDSRRYPEPEIKVSEPPYRTWKTLIQFPFRYQGPCLKRVGDTVVISGRAFFEDERTPLLTEEMKPKRRGMLVMTVDVEGGKLVPELMLPHSTGPQEWRGKEGFPDISYARIVDLARSRFGMSYYEGYKFRRSWIRLAVLSLE
jgi:hypothetical protein